MKTYQNPIKKHGDFADPFVLRYNGKYYLYGTNPDVRCWSSDDLVNWTPEGATVPEEEFPDLVPFAPEVVYWNGTFYMYTSPHGLGHYVLSSKSPTGPFRKITGNIGHSIDFSVFIDDDGQWYAFWADERGILGCKMNSPTEFGEQVLVGAYLHGWTEGPFVVKAAGKYHLTYTGNHFLSKGYRVNAAVADSPLGPYRDNARNPVLISTEGRIVGLGHSSTVLGPDLHCYYIIYHNLNPDKTRDLNLDPVVFTSENVYVLGPTTTPRPAPRLPAWQCLRPVLLPVQDELREPYALPAVGTAEYHIAALDGTTRYGIAFAGEPALRLEFNVPENTVSLLRDGKTLSREVLLLDYVHTALHCIRIAFDGDLTVYLDGLRRLTAQTSISGRQAGYFSDAGLKIGSASVQPAEEDALLSPIPCTVPGDRVLCLEAPENGKYQFFALHCGSAEKEILLDGEPVEADDIDRANGLLRFSAVLSAGLHSLDARRLGAGTICAAPFFDGRSTHFRVETLGPYDKICEAVQRTDTHFCAEFRVGERLEGWQAGVLLRASQLADGGEGKDKRLGTDFMIGYRVCVSEGKLQLWKHRYDAQLMGEIAYSSREMVSFSIRAASNQICVCADGTELLSCSDPQPILYGCNGFHARGCTLLEGTICADE